MKKFTVELILEKRKQPTMFGLTSAGIHPDITCTPIDIVPAIERGGETQLRVRSAENAMANILDAYNANVISEEEARQALAPYTDNGEYRWGNIYLSGVHPPVTRVASPIDERCIVPEPKPRCEFVSDESDSM